MIIPESVLALAAAVTGAAAAVGPASACARRYLTRLESVTDTPVGTRPSWSPQQPRVRARWLLSPLPQAALAVPLATTTLLWGLRAHAPTETVIALPAVCLLAVACSVDAVCHRLPNRLLGAAAAWLAAAVAAAGLAPLLATALTSGGPTSQTLWFLWPATRGLLCALAAGAAVLVLALLPSGLGLGDVKLSAVLALWLGHIGTGVAGAGLVLGFLLGGAAAGILIITRRVGRRDHLALGPYLATGGWLSWLLALG